MPWPWGQKNPVVGVRPKSPFGIANAPPRSTTPTPNEVGSAPPIKPRSASDTSSLQNAHSRSGSALGHRRAQGSRSSRPRRSTNDDSDISPEGVMEDAAQEASTSPVPVQPPQLKPQRMSRPFGDLFAQDLNFRLVNGSSSDVDTSSPVPSSPGMLITRSQKAIIPPQLRNGSDGFPQRQKQIQEDEEESAHEIRTDPRSNAVVSPAPSTASSNLSTSRSREARLEAQVLKLRKLVAELKETNARGPPTPTSPPSFSEESSQEAHRVAHVFQGAYEQLKKKYDSLSDLLKERTNEMNRIQALQYSEIDEIRQAAKKEKQTLVQQHASELEDARLFHNRQINEMKRDLARGPEERARLLETEVEEWKKREKTLLENYERMMDEMRRRHDIDLNASKKRFDEAQTEWESKAEDMRRSIDAEREALRKESRPVNSSPLVELGVLKAQHEQEVNALKMSIKVLEGSRGVSLKDVDDQQSLYEKISQLESSLSSKVRALAGERKTVERLRTTVADLEQSKADLWLQKDASEEKMKAMAKDHKGKLANEAAKREEMAKKYAEERAELLQSEEQKRMELLRQDELSYEESLSAELEKRERIVRDFERRIKEMVLTHEAEKSAIATEHESVLRAMEDKLLADAVAAAAEHRRSLEFKESRQRELEASLAQMRRTSLDDRATLEAIHRDEKLAFEKEKENLAGEYQVVISRGEKALESERKAFADEKLRWEAEKSKMMADFEARLEKELHSMQAEVDSLRLEAKSQKEEMERKMQRREENWVRQQSDDKDAAMKFVRELQQQKEEEEKKKQNLLDRIAQIEVEKEALREDLSNVKGNHERSAAAGRQLNEKLAGEKSRSKALEENVADLAEQLRKAQETIASSASELRSQLQEKDKAYNDLYARRKRQIEDLELDIRNGDTKITMLEVELESVKKLVSDKEEASKASQSDIQKALEAQLVEKDALIGSLRSKFESDLGEKDVLLLAARKGQEDSNVKHEQKIEALLNTIGKLEETCNKTRTRSNEDARVAEARLIEQQNLVTTWQSVANKRIEDIERLQKSVEDLTGKADSYKNEVKLLKTEIKQLEKDIKAHKSEIKTLTKDLKAATDDRHERKRSDAGEGPSITRKVSDLEKLNEQLVREIEGYKVEVTNYMTDTHELDMRLKEYEGSLRQLENEAQRKDAELERLQKMSGRPRVNGSSSPTTNGTDAPDVSVKTLKRDLEDATKEIDRLREKIESYEIEYRILFGEHERLKAIGEGHITNGQMHQMIDSLEKELDRTKRAKRDMEMRLQSAELRLATTGNLYGQQGQGAARSQSSMSYVRPHGDIYEDDEGNNR